MSLRSLGRRLGHLLCERSFWLIFAMIGVLTLLHYLSLPVKLFPDGFLERHAMERIAFLLPVATATFAYGRAGGLITLGAAFLIMLPRVFWISVYFGDALLETLAVGLVGGLVIWMIATLEREKRLRQEAVSRLRTVNVIGAIVTKSLELEQILNDALDKILEVTQVKMGFIFLVERGTQDLVLTVQRGVPPEFADEIRRLRMGESLSGLVALTARPRIVDNLLQERQLTTSLASRAGMRSFVAVPLMSRERVLGVMDLADSQFKRFAAPDVELLMSVGNEIGVAIENAYLYESMRHYAQQITRAQEDERARIARELHDDTIQSLIVLSRQLETLARTDAGMSPAGSRRLAELQRITDGIIQGVRRFSRDLRPSTLDDLGLLPTLEGLAASMTEKDGIPTRLSVSGEQRRLSLEVELALFRVAQEALTNVKKHAAATQVVITVKFTNGAVEMAVRDNGRGFVNTTPTDELTASGHLGLIGMHERARLLGGTLLIQSKLGSETRVSVTVPTDPPYSARRSENSQPLSEPLRPTRS